MPPIRLTDLVTDIDRMTGFSSLFDAGPFSSIFGSHTVSSFDGQHNQLGDGGEVAGGVNGRFHLILSDSEPANGAASAPINGPIPGRKPIMAGPRPKVGWSFIERKVNVIARATMTMPAQTIRQ